VAVLVIAVITALPLLASQTFSVLVTGAVGVMYVAYFALALVMLIARLKGWPRQTAPFTLGPWGLPLNIIAVLFTGAVMVNLMWPRDATNPSEFGIPVAWILAGAPALLGLAYYVTLLHKRLHSLPTLERPDPHAAPVEASRSASI
jgi:amino acid transporter